MMQTEFEDKGTTNWRTMPCPSCGQPVAWTVVTPAQDKVACTNDVGERNQKSKCGFTLRRAEWDYLLERGDTHSARKFLEAELERWYALAKNAKKRRR